MSDYFEDIGMLGKGERLRFAYLIGLCLSLILTFGAYALVTGHLLSGAEAVAALLTLALTQFAVQLVFFLHMGREMSSRTRLVTMCCAIVTVSIVVVGSLWIMNNLAGRMVTPQAQEEYMQRQPGI